MLADRRPTGARTGPIPTASSTTISRPMSPHHGARRMPVNPNIVGWAIARRARRRPGLLARQANGHERGVLETQATHDARRVDSLAEGLDALRADVVSSTAMNKELRTAMAGLEQQNKTSNTELKMRLRNLARLALFSAVSMLTACGSSAPRQTEPMPWRPAVLLPAELARGASRSCARSMIRTPRPLSLWRRCTACTAPAQASTWTPSTTSTSRGRIGEDRIGSLAAHHAAAGILGPAQALEAVAHADVATDRPAVSCAGRCAIGQPRAGPAPPRELEESAKLEAGEWQRVEREFPADAA